MVADLFHYGHVKFLQRARAYGDFLVVGVLSDSMARRYKRIPVMTLEERLRVVQACRYVDETIVHDKPVTNDWLLENGFSAKVRAVGNERDRERIRSKDRLLDAPFRIEVPYQPGISTTAIIERVVTRIKNEEKQ